MALPKAEAEKLHKRLTRDADGAELRMRIPPLESGDRLTRDEFERRYKAMPNLNKAELIEGVVYMPSPVRHKSHSKPHRRITTWLSIYCENTPGTDAGDNGTLRLDSDNEPQPDAMLFIEESAGGRAHISDDDYVEGSPDLIVEIAASSASYDLHDKFQVYRRNGVREYIVWRTYDRKIEWFRLHGQQYIKIDPDSKGIISSSVFPGLRLDVKALLDGDMKKVFVELQRGLKSKEHKAFVKQLAEKSKSSSKRK
jgi:Uma2 family endonuclease